MSEKEKIYTKEDMIKFGEKVREFAYNLWSESYNEGYRIEFMKLPPLPKIKNIKKLR